jgi:hypothetical protein
VREGLGSHFLGLKEKREITRTGIHAR